MYSSISYIFIKDITLFPDMSIEEHLNYYGRLYAMPVSLIRKRSEEFVDFLHLPSLSLVVKNLRQVCNFTHCLPAS